MQADDYQLFTTTTKDELLGRVHAAAGRFRSLLADVDPALPLPNTTWTARDTLAHVLTVVRRYTRRDPRSTDGLGDTPREVDRINERELRALDGRGHDELLQAFDNELAAFYERYQSGGFALTAQFPFHGGGQIDGAGGLGNLIGELLIHGLDVARAAGRSWTVDNRDAVLLLNAVLQVLPAYLRKDKADRKPLAIRFELDGALPWALRFEPGALSSRPAQPGEKADVVVRGPASVFTLALYQRISPLAAVRQGVRFGGPRPWRFLEVMGRLEKP